MKRVLSILTVMILTASLSAPSAFAGNDNRRGTAGATELLINPWARSSSWGGINTSCARGIDAFFSNIAGLSFVEKTEFVYSNTMLYGGRNGLVSGASVNAFGLALRLGDAGVLGAYVMAMGCGDIYVTTPESPEPGSNGTISPTLMNLNVAFSYSFTTSIHGGANIKVITESTDNVTASGVALDAGIQYQTGENDELKFGISLKNIGLPVREVGTAPHCRWQLHLQRIPARQIRSWFRIFAPQPLPGSCSLCLRERRFHRRPHYGKYRYPRRCLCHLPLRQGRRQESLDRLCIS